MNNRENFDLKQFDSLAKQNGIDVRYFSKDHYLDAVYRLPAGHMTRLYKIQVFVPYFNKEDYLRESECSLRLYYQKPDNKKKEVEVRINCKTQKEAFGFLYLLLFMPERIGYALRKGEQQTDVTSDELFLTGRPFRFYFSDKYKWKYVYTLTEDPNVDGYLITGIYQDKKVR